MKPINLKIKGLNSFIEMQEIDFETLTEKGLFGIFGPTGSGKSTILDGITLALYGEVPRKSTDFINTNCDTMSVSFEFEISHKEVRRYRVDRDFRRDSKTGGIRTRSAIIVDLIKNQVLEDKVRSVTEKCQEIIGLNIDDFTRTVVLPQGKFSEFLKLEGRERREMLERLFNLQKYGDDLSYKLAIKIREENQKLNILEGELKGYEDVSHDILQEKNKKLEGTKDQVEKYKEEVALAEKAYEEGKELWGLQEELKGLEEKARSLKDMEGEIKDDKDRLSLLERSLKVKAYVEAYESTLKEIREVKDEIDLLNKEAGLIKGDKETAEKNLSEAKRKKDIDLPKLKIREHQLLDGIEEKKLLDGLTDEKNALNISIIKIKDEIETRKSNLDKCQENIRNIIEEIAVKEGKFASLKVAEDFKNKVNDGFVLLNEYEGINKQVLAIEKDIGIITKNIEEEKVKSEKLSLQLREIEKTLGDREGKLDKLNENSPGDQDKLFELKEKLNNVKGNWDKNKEYTCLIERGQVKAEEINKELIKNQEEKDIIFMEIKKLEEEVKKHERENSAHTLRESLSEGSICPVCGSQDHKMENLSPVKGGLKIDKSNQKLQLKKETYQRLKGEIIQFSERLISEENNIKDNIAKINNLGEDYKKYSVESLQNEFDILYNGIDQYKISKEKLEGEIRALIEEKHGILSDYNNINSLLTFNRERLKNISGDLDSKNIDLRELESKLSILKNEISVKDFKEARIDIHKKEKEREALDIEVIGLRKDLDNEQKAKEILNNEYSNLKIQLNEKSTLIGEKIKNIDQKENLIKNKLGTIDNLERLMEEITRSIEEIENSFEACERKKIQVEDLFNGVNNKIISYQGNLLSLQERSIKDKEMLDKALREEGIENLEEAKKNFAPKDEIDRLKLKIENYQQAVAELRGALASLNKKINNRSLSQREWEEIKSAKEEKSLLLNNLEKTATRLEIELKSISEKLKEKNDLLEKKGKIDYQMSLLNDLERLFRGKKFIEFVATNQLKYVSIEGSKRLKEISGGKYGLEVDDNGKFLIRDYKNGGAERDVTTLSGGETFITSLALALALSAQIQLKGTAPLEFFFLDEGFGTLDDNLLDLVMDSLEKIHHKKLSIGIISHVESIKNRLPIKLIVSPPEAGLSGSKVRIERS